MYMRFHPKLLFLLMVVLTTWLLAACAQAPTPSTRIIPSIDMAVTDTPRTAEQAAENIRQLLARQLQIDPATITLVAAESVEWSDSCFGAGLPNESCALMVTPGHKLTFQVDGATYVIHSDLDGYQTRVVTAPAPAIGEMRLAWGGTFDNGECMEAIIGTVGVSFGRCGGQAPIGGKFVTDAREAVIAAWVATYAPFDAETAFGSIRLVGTGSTMATPAEQSAIGRWARSVAMEAAGQSMAGLRYAGPAEMGSSDRSRCGALHLYDRNDAGLVTCDELVHDVVIGARMAAEWQAILDRFAPFGYETETEEIDFVGMGIESGEAWQRAILAWARARYAELATGNTSATINTALSWHLEQDLSQKNVCLHLTVLDYGYAYAEELMCEGQDLIKATGDWLTGEELAQLDLWLYDRAALTVDYNYVNGQGAQPMSAAEQAAINAWAMNLYTRISGTGVAVAPAADVPVCPEAEADLAIVRDYRRGFCLLVPATHTIFDTNPDEITVVKESLLNVTDPRLQIAVTLAAGRTAEQFADAVVAEFAGFEIARSTVAIAGQPAVVLDNVPGQDLSRRVLITHNDRLYTLTFSPLSSAEIAAFYNTIIEHLVLVEPQ